MLASKVLRRGFATSGINVSIRLYEREMNAMGLASWRFDATKESVVKTDDKALLETRLYDVCLYVYPRCIPSHVGFTWNNDDIKWVLSEFM